MSPTNVETKFQNLLHSYSENRENFVTHEYVDISQSIENFRQLIVLGEPGSGKTTLLWRITFDYATKAKSDPLAPIPVFIHLGELVEDKNLTWLINEQLGRLASSFSDLLAEKRIAFMLDGLNEIANEHKNNALAEIRDLIEHCVKEDIVIVLTSRYREYVDSMDMGILNQISITPLNASQIYQFIRNHITNPPSAADDLFWTLAGDKARSHWEKLSKNVTLDFTAFWTSGSLPKGTVDEQTKQWWNEWITVRDTPQGWLPLAVNPFMLYMIIQVYSRAGKLPQNRGALFEVFSDFLLVEREKNAPDESREIKRKLADLAHAMMLINGTSVSQNEALKYLKDEGSLNRALDANLLSGNTEIRFSHQLFQEYFAARRIDSEMNIGTPAHQFFAPENWWEPSGWEETIMLLAGVYNDDCTPVLEWLHDAQPELTARCVKESGANTPRSTLEMLKQQWIPRLVDILVVTQIPMRGQQLVAL
ncbi:MAG: NACHT domain-containing protein [Anaerolineae bacterium]|nr:NACHT domain-containing protein [Anaerolineae bacterium]